MHRSIWNENDQMKAVVEGLIKKWLALLVCVYQVIDVPGLYPWRPRGSQSGRDKRLNESFQAEAEEPLGTDSHWTISKRSSEFWLLIGHKNALYYCAKSASSIYSRVLLVSYNFSARQLLSRHSVPVRSPTLCVRGKRSFSTFLTRIEGTTDESKNRFGCYQYISNSICSTT